MRFDGYSNYGPAHNTGATTPAAVQPEADVYGDTFRTVYDTAITNGATKADAAADASFAASAAQVLAAAAASVIRIDVKSAAKLPDMNGDHTGNTYALYCRGELMAVSTPESRSALRH